MAVVVATKVPVIVVLCAVKVSVAPTVKVLLAKTLIVESEYVPPPLTLIVELVHDGITSSSEAVGYAPTLVKVKLWLSALPTVNVLVFKTIPVILPVPSYLVTAVDSLVSATPSSQVVITWPEVAVTPVIVQALLAVVVV